MDRETIEAAARVCDELAASFMAASNTSQKIAHSERALFADRASGAECAAKRIRSLPAAQDEQGGAELAKAPEYYGVLRHGTVDEHGAWVRADDYDALVKLARRHFGTAQIQATVTALSRPSAAKQELPEELYCDAWSRRAWKCDMQCDSCFRRQYESRLLRAEKLLREFITTWELHKLKPGEFNDLWNDVEAAKAYFKDATESRTHIENRRGMLSLEEIAVLRAPVTSMAFDDVPCALITP